jgi:hypothetical protein
LFLWHVMKLATCHCLQLGYSLICGPMLQ